ncbi:MAG: hypothetical protein ABII88_05990 [Candidatus Omnitrophota bacterium]
MRKIMCVVVIQSFLICNISWANLNQECLSPSMNVNSPGLMQVFLNNIADENDLGETIVQVSQVFRNSRDLQWDVPIAANPNIIPGKQPAVVLIKPDGAVNAQAIKDEIAYWESQGYAVIDLTLYKGKALQAKKSVPRHYGVSTIAAQQGPEFILRSKAAQQGLKEKFNVKIYDVYASGRIYGGLELSEMGYSLDAIDEAWVNSTKIASGVYCAKTKLKGGKLDGQEIFVINGHVPRMIDYFENDVLDLQNGTTLNNVTIKFRIAPVREDATPLAVMRDAHHLGKTQLEAAWAADQNSKRSQYYAKLKERGLLAVYEKFKSMVNGDHLSDSLLNAMRESVIWGHDLHEQPLTAMLFAEGFNWDDIVYLVEEGPVQILEAVEDAQLQTEMDVAEFLKDKFYTQIKEAVTAKKLARQTGDQPELEPASGVFLGDRVEQAI